MHKLITSEELSEIVSQLLVEPNTVGELEQGDAHYRFVQSIAQVVAEFCGGRVSQVIGEEDELPTTVSIAPSSSLPSATHNVWAQFDPSGWEGLTDEQLEMFD